MVDSGINADLIEKSNALVDNVNFNRYPTGFRHIRVYRLDFKTFTIFGHSDTI